MAGGPITTGSAPKLLWPGIYATWGQVYNEHPPEHEDLYDIRDSEQAYEELVQMTPHGVAPVMPEGAPGTYDYDIQGAVQRATHLGYSLGWIVTHNEEKDNLYETVAMRRAQANAFGIRQTVETIAAAPYNDAFTGNVFTFAGGGTTLCSAAQVNATGGTYANMLSPGADLSEASLEDMGVLIMNALNDRGGRISVMPQSLHIAPNEWYNANRILKSVLQSDSATNNINVLKATNAFPKGIKLNHFFTAAHSWFVRSNVMEGMTMFWREKPDLTEDNDHDTKNHKYLSFFRMSVTCGDPRGIWGSQGP